MTITESDRADLAAIWSKVGQILRTADVVPDAAPVPTPKAPKAPKVEAPKPRAITRKATKASTPKAPAPKVVTPVTAGRPARSAQRGLIARLTGTPYNSSAELTRDMARDAIDALLSGATVELLGSTLVADAEAIASYRAYLEAQKENRAA